MESEELAYYISKLTLEKKAEKVRILDLKDITTITDFFVICTGETDIQIKAISDHLRDKLKEKNIKVWHDEGRTPSSNWVLLDLVDVVVHIFLPEYREYYALEKLWGDAKIIEVHDEG